MQDQVNDQGVRNLHKHFPTQQPLEQQQIYKRFDWTDLGLLFVVCLAAFSIALYLNREGRKKKVTPEEIN